MNALVGLRQKFLRLRSRPFVRNVVVVAMGIAAAQAISLAFIPFLTRLYGPEAFGALAAFNAVVNIITPLSTLGFAGAIVMPPSEEAATAVARLSLASTALVVLLSLPLVWVFQAQLASWTGLAANPGYLYLIPVSLILTGLLSVANQVAIRHGLFKARASAYVTSTLLMNIGKLVGGFLVPSGLVLIVISTIGKVLNFSILLIRAPHEGAFQVRRWIGTSGIREAAATQRDFAIYRMPQSIINASSFGLPVILLTSLFGPASAGQYSITTLLLGAPIMLLGQSVTEVFFPKVTDAIRKTPGVAAPLLRQASLVMFLMAIVPFGSIAVAGDIVIPFVLGAQWERAGEYSQWVAIWMASVLATRPAVAAMPVLGLQRTLLIYEILITGARVVALVLCSRVGNDLTAVAGFAITNFVGYFMLLGLVLIRAGNVSRAANRV